ncbi:hypothetical protein ACVI1T_004765 [Rhizobium redzepovicii]
MSERNGGDQLLSGNGAFEFGDSKDCRNKGTACMIAIGRDVIIVKAVGHGAVGECCHRGWQAVLEPEDATMRCTPMRPDKLHHALYCGNGAACGQAYAEQIEYTFLCSVNGSLRKILETGLGNMPG